jgi:hypothetical protein
MKPKTYDYFYNEKGDYTITKNRDALSFTNNQKAAVILVDELEQLRARVAALEDSLRVMLIIIEGEAKDAIWLNETEWAAIEKAKSLLQ